MASSLTLALYKFKKPSILPGFRLTLGFTLFYLAAVVIIPLSGLFVQASSLSPQALWNAVTGARVLHAYKISFGLSLLAASLNGFFGLIVAWVLSRYHFPGKKIMDAMVDLPFALPTAVAGIALTALYAPQGWIGRFAAPLGITIAFTPLGIVIALLFVGLPFVVRTVQPVLQDADRELEEAALCLGASRWRTFMQVMLPSVLPSLLTGFAMAFARGLGEYGSVIFIAGNIPKVSEIVPLVIATRLEQYDYAGATAVACVMLVASFILLFCINWLQQRGGSRAAA
ncbi:MAG: sulfate ABC transporter permease subunit CysT [Pseudomonadota bacterium]|nr:sulfate ABC transporter permease subunit CysT [Pseudomonadota bacterium]MDE3038059.1 sulfate ABC transporter permease subunit CysT [Pseudomonadota bacterium]